MQNYLGLLHSDFAFLLCFLFPIRKIFCLPFYFTKKQKTKDVRKDGAAKNDFLKSTRTSIITNILMDVHAR
jgi:hypothetical protein